jgi:hypothetical protein
MMPEWVGTWTVSVVNGIGEVVASEELKYAAAPVEAEAPAAGAPAEASTTSVADTTAVETEATSSETAQ